MTERMPSPSELPGWPRLLSLKLAAAYVGTGSATYEKEVEEGRWPKPQRRGRRKLWDRVAIDAILDKESGLAAESEKFDFKGRAKEFFGGKGSSPVHG